MKQNRAKKRIIVCCSVVVCILLLGLCFYFPIQRILAENTFYQYISEQVVNKEDIREIRFNKDYTQGGYFVHVDYFSDPEYHYQYHYLFLCNGAINIMTCDVFDLKNNQIDKDEGSRVKYKPLEWKGELR